MSNEHPPQPGPYGSYGPPQQPSPHGRPSPYGQPTPYGQTPYGQPYAPMAPLSMPSTVRAAQVVVFVAAGLALLLTVVVGAASGAEAAGEVLGTNLMICALFVLACQYAGAGHGVRVASVVLAGLQILFTLGAAANGTAGGLLPGAGAIAVIILLGQRSAGEWFKRPRAAGPYS